MIENVNLEPIYSINLEKYSVESFYAVDLAIQALLIWRQLERRLPIAFIQRRIDKFGELCKALGLNIEEVNSIRALHSLTEKLNQYFISRNSEYWFDDEFRGVKSIIKKYQDYSRQWSKSKRWDFPMGDG